MEKQRWEESERRRAKERRWEKRKNKEKEDAGTRKGRKVAKHCVCPMVCGSRGSKSRLAKAAGAEPSGQMRNEKLHAVVARSTFGSETAKSTSRSEHFWKLSCRKSARRCGPKHISKSKVLKTDGFKELLELLEVDMLKKCTPLWRQANLEVNMYKTHHVQSTFGSWDVEKSLLSHEAHVKVKMYKTPQPRSTFGSSDVGKVHAVVARSTFRRQNDKKNTRGSDHFWKFRCRFAWQAQGIVDLVKCEQEGSFCSSFSYNHYTTLHYTTLQYNYSYNDNNNYTYTTLRYTALHFH